MVSPKGEGASKVQRSTPRQSLDSPGLLSPLSQSSDFGPGGAALWEAMTDDADLDPGAMLLLVEACRIKDRLDRFAALLDGDGEIWARVRNYDSDRTSELLIDSALTEARMHAGQLRQLLSSIAPADSKPQEEPVADPLAEARAAREARMREANAAGS